MHWVLGHARDMHLVLVWRRLRERTNNTACREASWVVRYPRRAQVQDRTVLASCFALGKLGVIVLCEGLNGSIVDVRDETGLVIEIRVS